MKKSSNKGEELSRNEEKYVERSINKIEDAKVRANMAAVSYGIGVQNRYSAFLDDEDGFIPIIIKQRSEHQTLSSIKQNKALATANPSTNNSAKANSQAPKTNGRQNGSSNNKNDQQKAQIDHQQKRSDGKRPRPIQQQGATNNVQAPIKTAHNNNIKQVNNNQDNTANNNSNRFARSYSNQNHQTVASQHQSSSKENTDVSQHGKFARNNQRGMNRRQFEGDDKKQNNPQDDSTAHNIGTNNVTLTSEEEKRRRQQKRALDMKYKDPEKREARRQQNHINNEQAAATNDSYQVDSNSNHKSQRNRRQNLEGNKVQEEGNRGFKGNGRARGRREQSDTLERRDGQTTGRGPKPTGERQQRNRNGFGAGSRGSRGSRGDDSNKFRQDSDRQRPIPNFSDKLDFPSLAS